MEKKINLRFVAIASTILVAAFSRLIPHPANLTPIRNIALFWNTLLGDIV